MFSGLAGLQIAAENEQFEVAGVSPSDLCLNHNGPGCSAGTQKGTAEVQNARK